MAGVGDWAPNKNDTRPDGSMKGRGFLGALKRPDGDVSTELSIGVNLGGKEMEIPSLVPTLTHEEVQHLLNGGEITPEIVRKAADFAAERLKAGLPVFAAPDEAPSPMPTPAEQQFEAGFNGTAR